MGFSSGLSIHSPFAKKLALAQEISAERCKAKTPMSEEAKQRQKAAAKAWREKRKAENLAQRDLILSRR